MAADRDPIERILGGSRDLYDIATWERRTLLDTVAAAIAWGLRAAVRPVVVLLAVVIVLAQFAITGFAVVRDPVLGVLAVLSAVPALLLAGYIWYDDPTRRESLDSLVATFLLGVAFAGFAAVVNTLLSPALTWIPVVGTALFFFLVVGPIEELVKLLAVRFFAYRLPEFDAVVDGAVYGAVAGLGFASIENLIYITRVSLQTAQMGGNVLPASVGIAGVRSLAGPGHVIYSAFAGYYLGLAKFNPEDRGAIVVKGLLLATFVHATYNTAVSYVPLSFLGFVAFILVYDGLWLAVLFRKIARYRNAYHDAIAQTEGMPPEGGRATEAEAETGDK